MSSSLAHACPIPGKLGALRRCWDWVRQWAPWLLVLWPALSLAFLINKYAINAPLEDDFMAVPLLEKSAQHTLGWHDFVAPQMEHRIAWVRVVMVVFHKFWPGRYYLAQIWFTWMLLGLTLTNVGVLLKQAGFTPMRKAWPVLALTSLSLYWPVLFEIVLWPFLHQLAGLAFFLTAGLVVWQARWPAWTRWLLASLCALCATLSMASGIFVWLVLTPVIWWCAPMQGRRSRLTAITLWAVAFAVTAVLYFHGLKNEADPEFAPYAQGNTATMGSDLREFFTNPWRSFSYTARILGGSLVRGNSLDPMTASLDMGLLIMTLYAFCAGWWLWRFRDSEFRRQLLPWLAAGAYALATALSITLGRGAKGGIGAISLRYVIHIEPLLITLPVMAVLIGRDLVMRFPRSSQTVHRVLIGAGVTLAYTLFISGSYGERMMSVWSSARMRGVVNTLFYKTGCPLAYDYPAVRGFACRADDLGLLHPPMLKNRDLANFKVMPSPLTSAYAELTSLKIEKTDEGTFLEADGHAILKKSWRVADGIFLTYQDPADGHWEIFQVTQVTGLPLYLSSYFARDLEFCFPPQPGVLSSLSTFRARFRLDSLPKGVCKVASWAYDYQTQRVALIPECYEVDTVIGTVKTLGDGPEAAGLKEYVEGRKRHSRQ